MESRISDNIAVHQVGNIPCLEDFGAVPIALEFSIDSYPGPMHEVGKLRRKSGWLRALKMTLDSHALGEERYTIACITDNSQTIFPWRASKLLEMRCSLPLEIFDDPPEQLDALAETLYWDFLGSCDLKHLKLLGQFQDETDKRAATITKQMDETFILVEKHISQLRKERRLSKTTIARKTEIDLRIKLIRSTQDKAVPFVRKKLDAVESDLEQYEADVNEAIQNYGTVEELYTIHWTTRSLFNKRLYNLPFQEVGFTRPDTNHKTMHMTQCLLPVDEDEDPITIPPMPKDGKRLLTEPEKKAFALEEKVREKYASDFTAKPNQSPRKVIQTTRDPKPRNNLAVTENLGSEDSHPALEGMIKPDFDDFEKELLDAINQVENSNSNEVVAEAEGEGDLMGLKALRDQHEKRKLEWEARRKKRHGVKQNPDIDDGRL